MRCAIDSASMPMLTEVSEVKLLFTGPMGAGKTTAIKAISDIPVVSTEVDNTDLGSHLKDQTTVAMDYGHIQLPGGAHVRLFGTPGQERFNFMWDILAEGALGVIILIDASHPDALRHLDVYVSAFERHCVQGNVVIGLGRTEHVDAPTIDRFRARLANSGHVLPILSVDVRRRGDVNLLVESLLALLEAERETGVQA